MHFIKWMNDDWLHMELRKLGFCAFSCTCGFGGVGGRGGAAGAVVNLTWAALFRTLWYFQALWGCKDPQILYILYILLEEEEQICIWWGFFFSP